MIIGFSDGVFHRLFTKSSERYQPEFFNYLQKYSAIEIHSFNENLNDKLFANFSYISLHAPAFIGNLNKDLEILRKIEKIVKKFNIANIVIHPDTVKNWSIFQDFQHLPISLENMDSDKKSFKTVVDFEKLFETYDFNITLDLNHIYSNDPSMYLAKSFQEKYPDKIVQYHISAYSQTKKHKALYSSHQLEILQFLLFKDRPIIIESEFNDVKQASLEYNYICKNLIK